MKAQTRMLMGNPPIVFPNFIMPLINAYNSTQPNTSLNLNVFAEPYYGDFNDLSVVLLTHNPGQASQSQKGLNSAFHSALVTPNTLSVEQNYYNMSVNNSFPNSATNRWVNQKNQEVGNFFQPLISFNKRLFIRDLVPYHGVQFGTLDLSMCAPYLYENFFCQIIDASMRSEFYRLLNSGNKESNGNKIVIMARGSVWNGKSGLTSVGWDLVGRIYSNCYVYKANFSKIQAMEGVILDSWPKTAISHDIYIVVITPKRGGRLVVYKTKNKVTTNYNMSNIIRNYNTISNPNSNDYIEQSPEMRDFIDIF